MIKNEFKFLGKNIEFIAILYGLFLIIWGFGISYLSESKSLTSFIPSFLGLPIFLLSYLSIILPDKKKLLMHIVVTLGLIIFLGGLDFLRGFSDISGPFGNFWAGSSKLMMLISGLYFNILCIQSFRFARKNKNLD